MKKYLALLLFISIQTLGAWSKAPNAAGNLDQFVGRYKRMQGSTVLLLNMYVENGKLVSKQLWDFEVLPLEQKSGDDFTLKMKQNNWPVKFVREGNKVTQMLVAGHDLWTKVDDKPLNTEAIPANPSQYLGKYKATVNQKEMVIEVTLKDGKIWGTQLWDGGKSPLTYLSADNFFVNALDCPLAFKKGSDKKVNQLVLNNKEVFTKVD
ncbi:hypothetical protein [Mucilaginibacter auburnensis]|uniref:Uncharacterized protein n=1 Tax=Mucilaginibacter auburnensis TaxID=1457233 RepID=A0A2H9VQK8_9SPHI|nr:hypothetical protein [Mucilaginibacter auburnensis]PJJ83116.1 hypothetical protein CLV57_0094 [Mucilaginibacter auburnensis]